ncbi:MAG: hypothetical protein RR420_05345 [Anaerovoracaceae bacterium]
MTPEAFGAMIKKLKSAYRKENISQDTINVYYELLEDMPDELGLKAALQCMTKGNFFPSIAELRSAAADIGTATIATAEEAWEEVNHAIRYTGSYKSPKFSQPLIGKVVEMMGWRNLCFSENPSIDRAQFIKYYNTYRERKVKDLVTPKQVRELGEKLAKALPAV